MDNYGLAIPRIEGGLYLSNDIEKLPLDFTGATCIYYDGVIYTKKEFAVKVIKQEIFF